MVPKDPKACHRFAHVSCLHCLFPALDQDFYQHLSAGHPLTWYDNLPQFQVLKRWSFDEVWSIMVHISPYHGPLVHHPIRLGFSAAFFSSCVPRASTCRRWRKVPSGSCHGQRRVGSGAGNIWEIWLKYLDHVHPCTLPASWFLSLFRCFVQLMFSRFCPAPSGLFSSSSLPWERGIAPLRCKYRRMPR